MSGFQALHGPWHGGSRIWNDGRGRTGGTQRAGTGADQRELSGERGGPEQKLSGTPGAAGPAPQDQENIYQRLRW